MTKTINWLGQKVMLNKHPYLVIYFYLPDEQIHPVNNIIFDASEKPMQKLSIYNEQDAKTIELILNSDNVEYLNSTEIKIVEKIFKKNKQKFKKYLQYHNKNLGDILDWRIIAGQELAYVFNGNALSKIYMFYKQTNTDYQLLTPYNLNYYQILVELEMLKTILKNTNLNANLFIQVAQNMFFAVMPIQKDEYLIDICIWDEKQQKVKIYSHTTIYEDKISNKNDKGEQIKSLADKLELALKTMINRKEKK